MSLVLRITDAGRAALVNAARDGTNAVRIASVGVSPTAIVAAANTAALPGEVKRIATISGAGVAADVIHLVVRDETAATYTVRSLALYLTDGTLFGAYGQPAPIIEKSAGALLLLAIDATLLDVAASQITFGNANFLNPAATTTTPGVVELATDAEATALTDVLRALTPKNMAAIFTAANILSRLLAVDGAGSGLDADLLDGRHAAEFALLSGANFSGGIFAPFIGATGPGLGSVISAPGTASAVGYVAFRDSNGSQTAYIGSNAFGAALNLVCTAGFAFQGGAITRGGNIVWDAANDGAGSGLDADLLDGLDASAFLRRNTGLRPIDYNADLGLLTIRGDASGWATNYGFRGSAGTHLGGFGARGTGDSLSYFFVGPDANAANSLKVYPDRLTFGDAIIWHAGNDGAGSGLDADLLDGQHGSYYADVVARLGYTPLNILTYTAANILSKLITVDGAGSGLDADLLDGLDATAFLRRNTGTRPIDFNADLGLLTIRGEAGGWGTSYGFRGSAGTHLGGFGALGAGDAVSYYYVGPDANAANSLKVYSDRVTFGNALIWNAANDGSGSGLDADLLDGLHSSAFLQRNTGARPIDYDPSSGSLTIRGDANGWATGYNFRGPAGSTLGGFGALGGGDNLTYYYVGPSFNAPNSLKVYPDRVTFNDAVLWNAANDGSGSGLDADLLDGRHATDFVLQSAFGSASLAANGYQILPGGLILQWVAGAQHATGSEPSQFVAFPITFPNACLKAFPSTRIDSASNGADVFYQLVGAPSANGAVVQRQYTAQGSDNRPTSPDIWAIGY